MRVRPFRIALVAMSLIAGLLAAGASAPADSAEARQSYIVVFEDGVPDARTQAAQLATFHGGELGFVYEHALSGFSVEISARGAAAIASNPLVAYVEKDQIVNIAADTSPSDPLPTGIDRINADQNSNLDIDGTDDVRVDAVVAVIDTGIDFDHPDLNVDTGNSVNCAGGSPFSASCTIGAGDDDNGHGTHVAGTIGALDNGADYGDIQVVGVAPGVSQWAIKVLRSDGSGYISWIVAGIDYVTQHASTVDVANMSLGCECSSDAMDTAIAESVSAGVAYAVAAGNSDKDASTFSPANHPDVITVSALADFDGEAGGDGSPTCRTDEDDTLANFSNFGDLIEVTAPGVCILSAWNDGGYNIISGTSMASPHAAGAAALLAASGTTSPADIESALVSTGKTDWTDDSGDGTTEPRVDVANETVFNPATTGSDTTTDSPPSVSITNPGDGATVSGTVTITADASDDGSVTQVEFFVGTTSIGVDTDSSDGWGINWDSTTVTDGSHTLTATATDDATQTASHSISVTVDNVDDLPSVSITNPADGATVSGTVTITADASDDGSVTQVEFFVGTTSIGVDTDSSDGWGINWDSTTVTDGSHTLTATATDDTGQTASHSISVTVDNTTVTDMHVGDLDANSINNGSTWTAEVTITIHDGDETALAGAVVSGEFTFNGSTVSDSCTTDSSGQCTVTLSNIHKRHSSVTYTVSKVALDGETYTPDANHDPDGDSDGTTITVAKP